MNTCRRSIGLANAVLAFLLVLAPASATHALTFFTNEASFQAAFPGLPVEDFEGASVAAGSFQVCQLIALESTANYCGGLFGNPAGVLPGFRLGATDANNTTIVSNAAALVGNSTVSVGVSGATVTLRIVFTDAAAPAVGLRIIGGLSPNQNVSVRVFNSSSTLLGSTTVNAAGGAGTFLGIADPATARIDLNGGGFTLPFIDNLRFQVGDSDLQISKTGVDRGDGTGIFSLQVTNLGPDDESAADVVDVLPAGVTYVSDTCGLDTAGLPTLVWPIGPLVVDATASCDIEVTVQNPAESENSAQVTGRGDPQGSMATASLSRSDLAIAKTGIDRGDGTGHYTLEVTNLGPDDEPAAQVVDVLPAGVTYVSDTCGLDTAGLPSLLWSIGALALNATVSCDIEVTVQNPADSENSAQVTGTNDPLGSSVTASLSRSDLTIAKTGIDRGDGTAVYTLEVTNLGPDDEPAAEVVDVLPAGVTYVSDTCGLDTAGLPTLLWSIGPLTVNSTASCDIEVTVQNPADSENSAQVSGTNDPLGSSATASLSRSDLAIAKSGIDRGDGTGLYTLEVTNLGPDDEPAAEVVDVLPAGVTYISDTCGLDTAGLPSLLWSIGTLALNATVGCDIEVTVQNPADSENSAQVTGTNDPLGSTATASLSRSDLAIAKSGLDRGDGTGVYTLEVTNLGPDDEPAAQVVDVLPAGVTYVTDTCGLDTAGLPTLLWSIGPLTVNSTASCDVEVTVQNPADSENSAQVTGSNDPLGSSATAPLRRSDLAIAKSGLDRGDGTGVYTLEVTNLGPDDEPAAQVVDVLPAGVTYVSDTCGLDTAGLPTLLWSIGALPVNATVSCSIEVTVQDPAASENSAQVTGSRDPQGSSAVSSLSTSDLSIAKSGLDRGDGSGVYTLQVTNLGPDDEPAAQVVDVLPAGVTYVSDTCGLDTAGLPTLVWSIGPLPVNSIVNCDVEVTVQNPAASENSAQVTGTNDPQGSSAVAPLRRSDLEIFKSGSDRGDGTGIYLLDVTNLGPDDEPAAELVDILPTGVTYLSDTCGLDTTGLPTTVWQIGPLALGEMVHCEIEVTVEDASRSANSATVTGRRDPAGSTAFSILEPPALAIPTLDWRGLLALVLLIAALGCAVLKRFSFPTH